MANKNKENFKVSAKEILKSPKKDDEKKAIETENTTDHHCNEEQLNVVKRIQSCTNFYDILNVQRDAKHNCIRKAYKRLAIQLHPDKNYAPGAEDAFKLLGKAWSVLGDESCRKKYDLIGGFGLQIPEESTDRNCFTVNGNLRQNLYNQQFRAFQTFTPSNFNAHNHQRQNHNHRHYIYHHHWELFCNGNEIFEFVFVFILFVTIYIATTYLFPDAVYYLSPSNQFPVEL